MIFSLIIQCSPQKTELVLTALDFARTLLRNQHKIHRIFFYGEGVLLASSANVFPQDETDVHSAWRAFIAENQIDAVTCIAASLRRGILNDAEKIRYEKTAASLAPEYDLSGLGQLIDASVHSDKLITFA
ncbi:MAG: sulfurtransferase complex subunit TusD [Cellvibrionaceae bacterium]|nr:sulfurtransferase complex subunit TusD [Cellvibrionaceae bacterium]